MLMALAYILIAGMAYGIAYWISSTRPAYWRSITGFLLALITSWSGGVLIAGWLFSLFNPGSVSHITLSLIGSGFWCALFGAGYGVYRARFKLATGKPAPALSLPKWVTMVAAVVAVIGVVAAVALPAYQNYAKRQAEPSFEELDKLAGGPYINVITPPAKRSQIDEFLDVKPNPPQAKLGTSEKYQYQDGVAAAKRGDYAIAAAIFHPFAELGHLEAQFRLGSMYHFGNGVPKDYIASAKWYRLAANQGHALAQSQLGMMYDAGEGVLQNYPEAVKLYRMAAAQGDSTGQNSLGIAYAMGRGVQQDYIRAHMWLNLAGVSGASSSSQSRDAIANSMTQQQIAQAQQMARECQKRNFQGCD